MNALADGGRREARSRRGEGGVRLGSVPHRETATPSPRSVIDDLVSRAYGGARNLEDLLSALLRGICELTGASAGQLYLRESGTVVLGRNGGALTVDWLSHAAPLGDAAARAPGGAAVDEAVHAAEWQEHHGYREGIAHGPAGDAGRELVIPVTYCQSPVGELRLTGAACGDGEDHLHKLLSELASAVAMFEKRYFVQRWTRQHLGRPMLLVGLHPALRALDELVEKAAATHIPVLITGEFGTEKELLAAALHACGPRRAGRFVEVNCAAQSATDLMPLPADWLTQMSGGTLFINGIDELSLHAQRQLLQQFQAYPGRWGDAGEHERQPRLIAAATTDLHALAEDGRFSKALLAELDYLQVALPPLRNRPHDLETHVAYLLEKHGWRVADKHTPVLIEMCRNYGWPDNLLEMERVIARLAVMSGTRPIDRATIVQYAPRLAGLEVDRDPGASPRATSAPLSTVEQWVRHLLAGTVPDADMNKLHESLQRALRFLAEHCCEQISLTQLASHSHVSGSHLSHLFRTLLNTTFKTLLGRLRIEKACQALTEDPRARITDVAMDSGFTDLSHFEKLFRRIVGESPREYRRHMSGDGSGDAA
jgi:DNA-binding NtrC family response regulator